MQVDLKDMDGLDCSDCDGGPLHIDGQHSTLEQITMRLQPKLFSEEVGPACVGLDATLEQITMRLQPCLFSEEVAPARVRSEMWRVRSRGNDASRGSEICTGKSRGIEQTVRNSHRRAGS